MPNIAQLRQAAREIFAETLQAVDPGDAVGRAVIRNDQDLRIGDLQFDITNRRVYCIAIGKAAFTMALTIDESMQGVPLNGLMIGPQLDREVINQDRWKSFQGGHPLPTEDSLTAASEAFSLLERANQDKALVIFLLSGGGSAMMEWPASDTISLPDLQAANKVLVNCGASIAEINAVRRAFSAIKGGKLAARAPQCEQITLIVSDVPPGQEWNVASGPTIDPPADAPDARAVVDKYQLHDQLPASIMQAMNSQVARNAAVTNQIRRHFVLLDNNSALQAAAQAAGRRGFVTEIADEISDQPIALGCALLINRLERLRADYRGSGKTVCVISGGEFSCPVRGDGMGGRNLETALRLAINSRLLQFSTAAICAGTDGIDGNSPAAGALIDNTTLKRAQAIGIAPDDFLKRSDSYSFFVALGDVVSTGPTGTNVRDVRILLSDA